MNPETEKDTKIITLEDLEKMSDAERVEAKAAFLTAIKEGKEALVAFKEYEKLYGISKWKQFVTKLSGFEKYLRAGVYIYFGICILDYVIRLVFK